MPFYTSIPTLFTSIYNICKEDNSLYKLKFTEDCLTKFVKFEHDRVKDDDSVSSDDSTVIERENKTALRTEVKANEEWYKTFGIIISKLKRLECFYLESLDQDANELRMFWKQVARSESLRFVECKYMKISNTGNFPELFGSKNIEYVRFYRCEIGNDIGSVLGRNFCNDQEKEIVFEKCNFPSTQLGNLLTKFTRSLRDINRFKRITFCKCTFAEDEEM